LGPQRPRRVGAAYEVRLVSYGYEAVVFHVLVRERRAGVELGPPPGQGEERCGPIDIEHENGGVCTTKECEEKRSLPAVSCHRVD